MSSLALTLPRRNPRAFLLIAGILWFLVYKTLEPLSHLLVGALPVNPVDRPPVMEMPTATTINPITPNNTIRRIREEWRVRRGRW